MEDELEMKRGEAIDYLQRKGKISKSKKIIEEKPVKETKIKKVVSYEDPKFDKDEEKEIAKVMKEGKIYGDPLVDLR